MRVYPWYNGAASGKTICLSDLYIHGMATDATAAGIRSVGAESHKAQQYYDLQGRPQSSFRRGLCIARSAEGNIRKVIH